MNPDLLATKKLPVISMRDLVYPPRPRRYRLPTRAIFVAAVLGCTLNCATARPVAVEAETVGQLSASYHSVAVAPLRHDAPPEFVGVIGSDDDSVSAKVETVTRVEMPETTEKAAHGF